MFWRQNTNLNNSFTIKIDRKSQIPTICILGILGILLDEYLTWSPQFSHIQIKLNQAIEILRKLRYQANVPKLKLVYHFLFATHLLYACELWGQNDKKNTKSISNFPKQSTQIMVFRNRYESVGPLYKNLKIIKLQYLFWLSHCLFMINLNKRWN